MLNTINTRLDAAIIAFILDHGEAKVMIADREFSNVVKDALALCKARPLVIDYDDPEFPVPANNSAPWTTRNFCARAIPISPG